MSSREQILRDAALFAIPVSLLTILLVGAALWLGGAFSFAWWARAILASALFSALLVLFVLSRTLRAGHIHTRHTAWRRVDKIPGLSWTLLLGMLVVQLFLCGVVAEWLAEWR